MTTPVINHHYIEHYLQGYEKSTNLSKSTGHHHCQVPFAGPKYPDAGRLLYGVPFASAVCSYTVFPHQFNDPAGRVMQKKMMTVDTATPESSAAEST